MHCWKMQPLVVKILSSSTFGVFNKTFKNYKKRLKLRLILKDRVEIQQYSKTYN